jgi:hypothetical protein|tara:strand:+ start:1117 stop:1770 length:654 start_codon:yes stop_codon:yes gene_type:complete
MGDVNNLLRELIREYQAAARLAEGSGISFQTFIQPTDYRSGGGRGQGVPAASKFTSDTPQRTQLGRLPKPTPRSGQTGAPSAAGVDYMASVFTQNSGDDYYTDEIEQEPPPGLGFDDDTEQEKLQKKVRALIVRAINQSRDPWDQTPVSEGEEAPDDLLLSDDIDEEDEEADEASVAAVGGVTTPLGTGPRYPLPSSRKQEPPSWKYYAKAVGGKQI